MIIRFLLLVIFAISAAASAGGVSSYGDLEVLQKLVLGGDGSWGSLCADSRSRRLYIARSNRVMVVDLDSKGLIGEIDGMIGVQSVALAPEFNKGFITCSEENSVRIFDLKTWQKIGRSNSGRKPGAIVYDPGSKQVFVFNRGDKTATVILAATGKVVGQVQLGGAPEAGVADNNGKVYVSLRDKNEIAVIDTNRRKLIANWPVSPGAEPYGLSIDTEHQRLFCACHNRLMAVMDADTGKLVCTLPIGAGVDATAFDTLTQNAFSSNGQDGTLTVVHESDPHTFAVVQTLPTQEGARTMAFDSKEEQLWLVTATQRESGQNELNAQQRVFVPESFTALIVGKHIPVDDGIPFSRKNAAFIITPLSQHKDPAI